MKLPQHLLEQIEYAECTSEYVDNNLYDIFTIHFKQWWKRKRVIKIRRGSNVDRNNTSLITYTPSTNTNELMAQLDEFINSTFDKNNEDFFANKKKEGDK